MGSSWLWMAALTAVIVYCVVQVNRGFHAKRHGWAAAAALAIVAALFLAMPVQTHVVKIDLPISDPQ